ncbi:hypothetical protein ACQ5SP_14390 [Rhodovulum sp. YNF3179]
MFRILLTMFCTLALAAPLSAQTDSERRTFGDDVFLAGEDVIHGGAGADDAFLAGDGVTLETAITGTAHMAGRRLSVLGEVGGDLYAAGMDILLGAPIRGDATVAGYDIRVDRAVGGDLRAAGTSVHVTGPVAGYALLTGEAVTIAGRIDGDVEVSAGTIAFGADAEIGGTLTLHHEDPASVAVPAGVLPAERITRRTLEDWEHGPRDFAPVGWGAVIAGFLGSVLAVGLIATLVAAIVPQGLARLREQALGQPFRTLWMGFLTLSVLSGAAILLAVTVIGIFVSPAAVLAALAVGFAGYVIGAYAFGVGLLGAFGRAAPDSIGDRALAAFTGALATGLVTLIPLLGWVFAMALTLLGTGALAVRVLRPAFFTERAA